MTCCFGRPTGFRLESAPALARNSDNKFGSATAVGCVQRQPELTRGVDHVCRKRSDGPDVGWGLDPEIVEGRCPFLYPQWSGAPIDQDATDVTDGRGRSNCGGIEDRKDA